MPHPTPSHRRNPWQGIAILAMLLCACSFTSRLQSAGDEPDLTAWTKTESPLFPSEWPPTSSTTWVSYTFAYGANPAELADGSYVTHPLARTEWSATSSRTTTLTDNMERAGVQGVAPLDAAAQAALENREAVQAFCLSLGGMPEASQPGTAQMRAYYRAWFQTNGAFLDLVRDDHAAFIDWVNQGP